MDTGETRDYQGIEILIVEDSSQQAYMLEQFLDGKGFDVSVAANGVEALQLLKIIRPKIIISDIMMPEMDGYELCRNIKGDGYLKDISVMLLTALTDPRDVLKALQSGADSFSTKPWDGRILLRRIDELLIDEKPGAASGMGSISLYGEDLAIETERGKILNFFLSTYDTALQKHLDLEAARESLRKFNERLEEKVAERTAELKVEIAAREALESKIKVAREIQQSLLPRHFPPFPHRKEFSLHGTLTPAEEVSGDFFDYFFLDDDVLALIIADVSGKGVPAALFMAVTRTLLRTVAMRYPADPAAALKEVNILLCQDNDACMFVTCFLACYNVKTGTLRYANAGHNETVLLKGDSSSSTFGILKDMVLGFEPECSFSCGESSISPGETIILFTDGVFEAFSPGGEQFGKARFYSLLESSSLLSVEELCDKILSRVIDFQDGNLADDITLIILRRNPG